MTAEQQLFDEKDSFDVAGLELQRTFQQQRQAFKAQSYPGFEQRRQHLQALYQLVAQHQDEIAAAISRDFSNRSADETRLFEVMTSRLI